MAEGIAYAHQRGSKVHVAVNTLLRNEEIGDFIAYAYQLAELQVDAVIIQDLGAAHLLRETLPQLPLHASTQCTMPQVCSFCSSKDLNGWCWQGKLLWTIFAKSRQPMTWNWKFLSMVRCVFLIQGNASLAV